MPTRFRLFWLTSVARRYYWIWVSVQICFGISSIICFLLPGVAGLQAEAERGVGGRDESRDPAPRRRNQFGRKKFEHCSNNAGPTTSSGRCFGAKATGRVRFVRRNFSDRDDQFLEAGLRTCRVFVRKLQIQDFRTPRQLVPRQRSPVSNDQTNQVPQRRKKFEGRNARSFPEKLHRHRRHRYVRKLLSEISRARRHRNRRWGVRKKVSGAARKNFGSELRDGLHLRHDAQLRGHSLLGRVDPIRLRPFDLFAGGVRKNSSKDFRPRVEAERPHLQKPSVEADVLSRQIQSTQQQVKQFWGSEFFWQR